MPPKKARKASTKQTTTTTAATAIEDWKSMKVGDLQKACKERGLGTAGNKAALVKRLQESDDGEPPAKLQKVESVGTQMKKAFAELKKEPKSQKKAKVDSNCALTGVEVYEDYDCMLNKTSIVKNNNKYYIIQLLHKDNKDFWTWNRWGRVGESGASSLKNQKTVAQAIADFKKKFKDKTSNNWDNRDNFVPAGKYTLLEMGDEDEGESQGDTVDSGSHCNDFDSGLKGSILDKSTQELIKLIFDNNMFSDQMKHMELDIKKMPLGKLSKQQIAKGFDALIAVEDAIKANKGTKTLEQLTSAFYTLIPHNFGRMRPPVMTDLDTIRKKKDMLLVLSDIELTQSMQKQGVKKGWEEKHPLDINYEKLDCHMKHLDPSEEEYKIITNYIKATGPGHLTLEDMWRIDRGTEDQRFKAHKEISHRKLLWHGTNIAVVAAILKTGLRIMPHSGGRVGKGIYFASENKKSAGYVSTNGYQRGATGIMFLAEVALGKENNIKRDDSSIVQAPNGFDSVVARGREEPDPSKDIILDLEGKKVIVPQGKPVSQHGYQDSSFSQSEYLVYKESQVRLRYLLKFSFYNFGNGW